MIDIVALYIGDKWHTILAYAKFSAPSLDFIIEGTFHLASENPLSM